MRNDDYIIVTCPIHGDFKQLAAGHIRGKGCKDCAGTITKTTEQFIIDARKVHGDEYDYSKSKYINAMTYIEIICRKHGSFWQKPNTHLIGKGCFECYGSKMLTQEEFINRCIENIMDFISMTKQFIRVVIIQLLLLVLSMVIFNKKQEPIYTGKDAVNVLI